MNGGEIFETTEGNGMSCEVHATLTTEGGSTGKITKFEIKKCIEPFGSFKTTECELNIGEGKGLPWTVDVKETDLDGHKLAHQAHLQRRRMQTSGTR